MYILCIGYSGHRCGESDILLKLELPYNTHDLKVNINILLHTV